MKDRGETFFYDGSNIAIRVLDIRDLSQVAVLSERLFSRCLESAHTGLQIISECAVSPGYTPEGNLCFCVVTLEGWCPQTQDEFDHEFLSPGSPPRIA